MSLVLFASFSREHDFERDEFPALILFVAAGMVMVVHATHLLSLLIGIETMSRRLPSTCGCPTLTRARPRR
jgi:NADH:ubiquinone oxidoreductase subunit 2 (subunit N)